MTRSASGGVVIVGAGGFGRETASLLRALQMDGGPVPLGFLDDDPALAGTSVAGLRVLGGLDQIDRFDGCEVVLTIGNPTDFSVKRRLVERLGNGVAYATLVHPNASIGTEVSLGEGTVLMAGIVVTHGAKIGRHVGIMPNVVLTHDDNVGDFATIGAGTTLAGGVTIGPGAYVGASVSVREHVTIGAGALVGMGSSVLSDVPPAEVWAGSPARRLR